MITHDIFTMPKAGSFCSKSRFFAITFTFIYFTASNGLNHRHGEATGNPGCVLRDWESPAGTQGVSLRGTRVDTKAENVLFTYTSGVQGTLCFCV